MSWYRSHTAAPTRGSLNEIVSARRAGCKTREDFRRHFSRSRLARAPYIMTAAEVAWALCREHGWVYAVLRRGTLAGEREELASGRFRWRCLRSDVQHLAAELEAGVTPQEDERVETIRLAEFEGRAGDPR